MQADDAGLVQLSHDLLSAIRARNRSTLDAILLPDFAQLDERGNRQGKEAFIAAVEAGGFQIEQLKFETLSVERFARIGVVSGVQWAQVRLPGGEQVYGRTAFTDVFVLGPAGWQLRVATSAELAEVPEK